MSEARTNLELSTLIGESSRNTEESWLKEADRFFPSIGSDQVPQFCAQTLMHFIIQECAALGIAGQQGPS